MKNEVFLGCFFFQRKCFINSTCTIMIRSYLKERIYTCVNLFTWVTTFIRAPVVIAVKCLQWRHFKWVLFLPDLQTLVSSSAHPSHRWRISSREQSYSPYIRSTSFQCSHPQSDVIVLMRVLWHGKSLSIHSSLSPFFILRKHVWNSKRMIVCLRII